ASRLKRIVEHPAPGLAFGRRQIVAEPVRPAAVHLLVDALLLHPGEPARDIAQAFHRGPARLGVAESEREPVLVVDDLQRRQLRAFLADRVEKIRWEQMAVGVDDHSVSYLLSSIRSSPRKRRPSSYTERLS